MTTEVKSRYYLIVKPKPKIGFLYLKSINKKDGIGFLCSTKQRNAAKKFTTVADAEEVKNRWIRMDKQADKVKNRAEWEVKPFVDLGEGNLVPESIL